jgi:hypothetical protein
MSLTTRTSNWRNKSVRSIIVRRRGAIHSSYASERRLLTG